MKGTIQTGNGEVKIDSGNAWSNMEEWGGKSWFPGHCEEEAKETEQDERAERYSDIEPS